VIAVNGWSRRETSQRFKRIEALISSSVLGLQSPARK